MFYKIIKNFRDIIKNFEIHYYKKFGNARSLVAEIEFIDESKLYIRDYIFSDGKRKYSFHWQDKKGKLLIRWDNSPHHLKIRTFPDHKHMGDEISDSYEIHIEDIMEAIKQKLK